MKTFANGRSILHKGDNLTHTAAPPDVCKTPSPAGPVPIPYVNVAMDSSLASGTKKVKVEGKMAAHEKANISTSMGDEPGTAGGLISSKFKGKLTWATSSPTVKLEGKGAVRFMDVTQHNGNSFNSAFIALGSPGLAYADDFEGQCEVCGKDPNTHRVLTKQDSIDICTAIIADLRTRCQGLSNRVAKEQGLLGGFMVGVMVCKCGQSHAARSGSTGNGSAFDEIAGQHADNVVPGPPATATTLALANPVGDRELERAAVMRRRFEDLGRLSDGPGRTPGYNTPGTCAGPKLLACGHAPAELTEMFYNSPKKRDWSASYWVQRVDRHDAASGSPQWQQRMAMNLDARRRILTYYEAGGDHTGAPGVASCQTCQELLYLATCDVDDWSC